MKTYVIVTGAVFGLVTLSHVLRVIADGPEIATQPWWVLGTVVAAALCLWACRLLWRARRP